MDSEKEEDLEEVFAKDSALKKVVDGDIQDSVDFGHILILRKLPTRRINP